MKLYIEENIKHKMNVVLLRVDAWNLPFEPEYVENIGQLPYEISANQDKTVSIIMPKDENTAFIYEYAPHKEYIHSYAGGSFLHRFSIIVFGDESDEVLELRIVHEYLHSINLAADDLSKNIPAFLTGWERLFYHFKLISIDEQSPYWQRKYYKWLFKT